MPLQLLECHYQTKMNTSSQIFQPRDLFHWSFISTLNLFYYPSLDVMQQLSNHQLALLRKTSRVQLPGQLLIFTRMYSINHVNSSEDCMGNFVRIMNSLARDIPERKKQFPFYKGNCRHLDKNSATHCWICEEPFDSQLDPEESIDLNHCHFSGQFLGLARENCNRARRYVNFTPVVGRNIQNYDLLHICLALNDCESTTTIKFIPPADEKYI